MAHSKEVLGKIQGIKCMSSPSEALGRYFRRLEKVINLPEDSWLKKLILVAADMGMKCIAVLKWVTQHTKTISIERQSWCNVQQAKFLQPQEVDLGGHGHDHEV